MARTSKKKRTEQIPLSRRFHVGIYARLSVDGAKACGQEDTLQARKNESIDTQIAMAKQYLKEHPEMELYDCYTDLGRTGTNFKSSAAFRILAGIQRLQRCYAAFESGIIKGKSCTGRNRTLAMLSQRRRHKRTDKFVFSGPLSQYQAALSGWV